MSGIVGDGNALVLTIFRNNKICQPLGGLADCIYIHPVCPCADNAAQATGAKFQVFVKTVFNLALIAFNIFQFFPGRLVKIIIFQPEAISVLITHFYSSSSGPIKHGYG